MKEYDPRIDRLEARIAMLEILVKELVNMTATNQASADNLSLLLQTYFKGMAQIMGEKKK